MIGKKPLELLLSSSFIQCFNPNRISAVESLVSPSVTGSALPSKASGKFLGQVT